MNINRTWKWITPLVVAGALCACAGGGFGRGRATFAATYSTGFYRPFGYTYGAWGPGYWGVGPPRGAWGRRPGLAMRPGFRGRSFPTIPMRPRGGMRRFGGRGWVR